MDEEEKLLKEVVKHIPSKIVNELRATLLREWKRKGETVIIFPEPEIIQYPAIYFFGFLAKDWPGLGVATMGVISSKWNLATSWGLTFSPGDGNGKIGIMIFGIEMSHEDELKRFLSEQEELKDKLYKVCFKGWRKRLLLTHGSRKLELFEEVMELLKRDNKLDYKLAEEVTKFFESRDEAYLEERGADTIAKIILTNYKFVHKVRETGGKPQVMVHHFQTKVGALTGITIVCWDRDFSLLLALDAIREAVPEYQLKYNKEFVTWDGVSVYRIEIGGVQAKEEIEKSILRKITTRKLERQALKQLSHGVEHYAKAIIPRLIKEWTQSKLPQVYISPEFTSPEFIHFKLVVVKEVSPPWVDKAIAELDRVQGFSVLGSEPPKIYLNAEVSVFDLRVDSAAFDDTSAIYSIIRAIIRGILGEFRDFDEGMRRIDIEKSEKVKSSIKRVNGDLLREIYYGIEDFCRINAGKEELVELVRLGVKLARTSAPHIEWREVDGQCTLIGLASKTNILSEVLKTLVKYAAGVSKIQIGEINILLLRVEDQGKSLSKDATDHIIQELTQLLNR